MRKLYISIVSVFILVTVMALPALAAYDYNVDVYVNDKQVSFPDQKAFVDNSVGRTYVPVRFVSEALGCNVSWDDKTQTAKIAKGGTWVDIQIGSINPKITDVDSGKVSTMTIDAPAMLVNDRTMVPLRFVSEALKAAVSWKPSADTGTGRGRVDVNEGQDQATVPGHPEGEVITGTDGGSGTNTAVRDNSPIPWVK